MKALIKGGVFLTLGWLAGAAHAQDIQFRAAAPKNTGVAVDDSGVRAVRVGQPVPLDGPAEPGVPAFRPLGNQSGLVARGQAPDDKSVQGIPKIEISVGEQLPPRPMPSNDKFTPPPPATILPGPMMDPMGFGMEGGCASGCDAGVARSWRRSWGGWGRPACDDGCCPYRGAFWISAEYLLWWQRGQHDVPPLVTTSPAGTPTINSGVLGQNTTSVLYDSVPNNVRNGGRFDVGGWFPHFCNLGFDLNFLYLGQTDHTSLFSSNGNPQIDRPITNVITGLPGSELVAINNPDRLLTGTIAVHDHSLIWGGEANFRYKLCCGPNYWVDLLFGYRHWNMSEELDVTENLQNYDPRTRLPAGNFLVQDSFSTRNQFNGFNTGIQGQWNFADRWFLGGTAKLAMGSVYEIININGSTTFSNFPAGFNGTFPGGLLALPGTNIGRYTRSQFGVMPELGFQIGYNINDHWRLYAGYTFIYLNNVVRPTDLINLNVNPTFQPTAAGPGPGIGPRQPSVIIRSSDYWAQGVSFGVMYRY